MDQVLANHIGQETPQAEPGARVRTADDRLPRDELLERPTARTSPGKAPIRRCPMRCIRRWRSTASSKTAATCETSACSTACKDRAASLSQQVSSTDQGQARRIPDQRPRRRDAASSACATTRTADDARQRHDRPLVTMERPDNGLPEDLREHTRLMCDIIALAFQTDKTRIASLLLCRDLSGALLPVPRRQGRPPQRLAQGHRPITTNASPASTLSQLAYLAQEARRHARRRGHRARQ